MNKSVTLVQCLRHIVKYEGPMALFKGRFLQRHILLKNNYLQSLLLNTNIETLLLAGLGPNLVGVAPSRAVYFCTYSQAKQFWNGVFPPDSPVVHVCSASCAGFTASTLTNPIWFVKTRLQLDVNKENRMTAMQCVRRIYRKSVRTD